MSENAEAFRAESLQIEASQDLTGATVNLKGEFDMTGTERFWSFSAKHSRRRREIAVDTSALEFIDSSGLMALIRARDAAVEAGVGFQSATRRRLFGGSPRLLARGTAAAR